MNSAKIRIGLSPCPNDTFICEALLNGHIDTEGLQFEAVFADVETLNEMAFRKKIDFLKVSFHAFLYLAKDYMLLNAGAALGRACGPVLIAWDDIDLSAIDHLAVAIPGEHTTANLLFSLAFPSAINKVQMNFSEIEFAVKSGKTDLGVIIHESRFTYADKGLKALMDLGAFWEGMTGLPIPLGAFILSRKVDPELQAKIDRIMRRSVDYALEHPEASMDFVRQYAQEMDEDVLKAHISTYVTPFTQQLDDEGRAAIFALFTEAHFAGLEVYQSPDFLMPTQ